MEETIAEHACLKHSRRVGRSAAAKRFKPTAVDLAVVAHVRHEHTSYDELLSKGYDRFEAREMVRDEIDGVLGRWEQSSKPAP